MLPGRRKHKPLQRPKVHVVRDPDSDDEVEAGVAMNPSLDTATRSHRLHMAERKPSKRTRTRTGPLHPSADETPLPTHSSVTTPEEEKLRKQVRCLAWLHTS
jgi:hypothetical protein